MSDENVDRWFRQSMEDKKIIEELINNNTKMRAALLLIAEYRQPYKYFSFNQGSKGVEDHFKNIAKEGLL